MLKDLVQETANNPGVGQINLGGAPANRISFLSAFGNNAACFYGITDGTQSEWGLGTVVAGSPNVLLRVTVLGTSAGNTAKLNFLGPVTVYNEVPSQYVALLNAAGVLPATSIADALMSRIISTTSVAIPSSTQALMSFNALGDSGMMPGLPVPTSGFTVPLTGRYLISASVSFAANTVGVRSIALLINGGIFKSKQYQAPTVAIPLTMDVFAVNPLAAGDTIQLSINQTSGAVLNAGGNGYDDFSIMRMKA